MMKREMESAKSRAVRKPDALDEKVAGLPHTIVDSGRPFPGTIPWIDRSLESWEAGYAGSKGADAVRKQSFREVNPSAKVAPLRFD